jgi:chlorobactene glucosyltransferase
MTTVETSAVLLLCAWLSFSVWPAAIAWTLYCLARQPRLGPCSGPSPETLVSIVVPVRNEADRILARSIGSMEAQDHPDLEIIVVNDRSTDGTGLILRGLADDLRRVRVIDGSETPEGWLGKPHALAQGVAAASGEWILMTDADIVFHPSAVSAALRDASENRSDALSLLPFQRLGGFFEQLFLPAFAWFCVLARPLHRVNDPRTKTSFGSGNFFLVRREALETVGGLDGVRDDVAEDLKLAALLKRAGRPYRAAYAPGLLETRMYAGLSEVWEGFSKNLFSGMKFSVGRTLVGVFWIIVLGILPAALAIAAFAADRTELALPLIATYFAQVILFAIVRIYFGASVIYALLAPFGFVMFAAILLNSARRILTGAGVEWKGRRIYEAGGIVPPKDRSGH